MKVVILAGGKGARLRPYTHVLPKPLIPVDRYPVLEIIIRQLAINGFKDITISTGYMSEIIESFCGRGKKFGVKINYSREEKPLGTAGSLETLRDQLKSTFMVLNGDVLVGIDFRDFINSHRAQKATVTMGLKKRRTEIALGVIKMNKRMRILDYSEKPVEEYNASVGIQLMEPDVLDYIKPGKYLDMPDLIMRLVKSGKKVQGYMINNLWLHLGRPDDFEDANENWRTIVKELRLEDALNNHAQNEPSSQ